MFDRDEKRCFGRVFALTALVAFGLARAATVETSDSRLIDAARTQDAKTVRSLLSQKADVNARSSDGSTALLWLAHWNDVETAGLLLGAGADANAANDFRMTPLSQACTNGSGEFVRLLLKSGANPNTAIATGETPLMTCAKTGNVDAVQIADRVRRRGQREGAGAEPDGADVGRRGASPGRGEGAHRSACGSQGP